MLNETEENSDALIQETAGGALSSESNIKRNLILMVAISLLFFVAVMIGVFVVREIKNPSEPTEKELVNAYYEENRSAFYVDFVAPADDLDYMGGSYELRTFVEYGPMTSEYSDSLLAEVPGLSVVMELLTAAKEGDADAYNACFTEDYIRLRGKYADFTPQKIYNVKIREEHTPVGGGAAFSLSYCIKDNDGTLRRDIISDVSRDMVLTIVKAGDGYKISATTLRFQK